MATLRAEKAELERIFRKYATVQKGETWFMTQEDFVCRYLQLVDRSSPADVLRLLSEVADTTKNRLISLDEFRSFESLLLTPDAIPQLAFKLFDVDNKGHISYDNFKKVLSSTSIHKVAPFDFSSSFLKQYFGQQLSASLDYNEFTQLLQSLPTEHARQMFSQRDKQQSGSIPVMEFAALMRDIRGFRMSSHVQENLINVAGGSMGRNVSYPYFKAFNQFLGNLDIIGQMVEKAITKNKGSNVTQAQLLTESQHYAQVTPLQVSLMFQLSSLSGDQSSGTISHGDFLKLLPDPESTLFSSLARRPVKDTPTSTPTPPVEEEDLSRSPLFKALEPVYRFSLGAIAGATGATAVYPIDLVKTRLQNQRGSLAGEIMYKNSFDCFFKVLKGEGFLGLYRGLLPQLVGVSPEKAIKLTANDTMRDLLTGKDGLPLWGEIVAGGCGGMCQVMFTNPLEIVKIRLQVSGEMAQTAKLGAVQVVKELGFMGLYKGASACFLRDIPFSAIYFPTYAHLKGLFADSEGKIGVGGLFLSGLIAGVPAAGLLTPADVIKTRLQVKARKGQQTYNGIRDCTRKIYDAEGFRAFWKGAPARIFRSSPQFGVTLAAYELLQRVLPVNFSTRAPVPSAGISGIPSLTTPTSHTLPDHIGGYKLARPTFAAVGSRYGLVFSAQSSKSGEQ